ncbi:hypothetical protein BCR37DRAFT_391420 [Protomyces lactucae-debilis]|uniref:Uncharacterized protein n=1 Tax=Protomyces lactucae-debilis TaxID=2754530 RepID=A0A1Y2FQQ4_PROLT|nr:uncharacterized protein BCR37DRAFT_391420 [Protomyces lactucae-debilis]ORY85654.1 hypothetical protein BCR37DRAFT_391420 [Protomyces lactucae-debilis]
MACAASAACTQVFDFDDEPPKARLSLTAAQPISSGAKRPNRTYGRFKRSIAPPTETDFRPRTVESARTKSTKSAQKRPLDRVRTSGDEDDDESPPRYTLQFIPAEDASAYHSDVGAGSTSEPNEPGDATDDSPQRRFSLSRLHSQLKLPQRKGLRRPKRIKRDSHKRSLSIDPELCHPGTSNLQFVNADEAAWQRRDFTRSQKTQTRFSPQIADEVAITRRPCVTCEPEGFSDDDAYPINPDTSDRETSPVDPQSDESDEEDSGAEKIVPSSVLQKDSAQSILQSQGNAAKRLNDRHAQLLTRRLSSRRVSFVQVPASPSPIPQVPQAILPVVVDTPATAVPVRKRAISLRHDRFVPPSAATPSVEPTQFNRQANAETNAA